MSETLGSTAFYLALLKGNNQQWKWDRGLKADCSNLFKMFFLGKINIYDFVSMKECTSKPWQIILEVKCDWDQVAHLTNEWKGLKTCKSSEKLYLEYFLHSLSISSVYSHL